MLPPEPRKAGYAVPILQQIQVRSITFPQAVEPPRERGPRPHAVVDRP